MLFDLLGDLLSPARCAACDAPVRWRRVFCPCCALSVERATFPSPLALPVAAVGAFGGALARAIHRLKYEGRPDLARPLGELMATALEHLALDAPADLIVPVPLAPGRLAERGYNQAALLAARLSRRARVPAAPLALTRVVETAQLAHKDQHQRQQSIQGAFRAAQPLAGRRVLLVDDVLTTGSTLGACMEALYNAGASPVALAVVARVERRLPRGG